jgi:hypothetical protein
MKEIFAKDSNFNETKEDQFSNGKGIERQELDQQDEGQHNRPADKAEECHNGSRQVDLRVQKSW